MTTFLFAALYLYAGLGMRWARVSLPYRQPSFGGWPIVLLWPLWPFHNLTRW